MSEEQQFTPGQLSRIGVVYDFIARLLPTEGRDFAVKFAFKNNDPSTMSVKFEPFTPIGKVWCDYCSDSLRKANVNTKGMSK